MFSNNWASESSIDDRTSASLAMRTSSASRTSSAQLVLTMVELVLILIQVNIVLRNLFPKELAEQRGALHPSYFPKEDRDEFGVVEAAYSIV